MSSPTVCAVVLTCNRLAKSRRCIEAVLRQTRSPDHVLIVDNASSDGTGDYASALAEDDPRITLLPLDENEGPAGGYAAGFEWAEEAGFNFVWAFADDVYPEPDCLEILLEEMGDARDLIVYPYTLDEGTGEAANYPQWSGVLIPCELIRRGGAPRRDLFWWIEDTEYLQWRLPRQCNARQRLAERAQAVHGIHEKAEKAAWKYYYEVRNTLYYRLWVQDSSYRRRLTRTLVVLGKSLARPVLREPHKLRKVGYVCLGAYHGIRGVLGKRVDPARG